jgi:hypothetical protein
MTKVMCDIVNLDRRLGENEKLIIRLCSARADSKNALNNNLFVKGALLHGYKFGVLFLSSHSFILIVFPSLFITLALLLSKAIPRLYHICSLYIILDFYL